MIKNNNGFFVKIQEIQKKNRFIPYVYALMGNTTLVMMQLSMKIVAQTLNPFFALYVRGLCLLILNTIVIWSIGIDFNQKNSEVYWALTKRSILSCIALSCFLGSVPYAPISVINSLFNVAPIVIFFIEAYKYDKSINKVHFGLTILSFLGIVFIIRPDFLFGVGSEDMALIYLILPLTGTFFHAYSMVLIHELKGKVSTQIAIQYFQLTLTLSTGIIQNFTCQHLPKHLAVTFLFSLIGLVLFSYITQTLITRATMLKPASKIVPFQYFGIVIAALTDVLIFGESFNIYTLIGIGLTSLGLLIKLITKQ